MLTKYNFNIKQYTKLIELYKAIKLLDIDRFRAINTEIENDMLAQLESGDIHCEYDEV